MLVGDDRVHLEASQGQIVVRPAPELAGLIEIRGLGIRRCDFTAEAVVGLVVDLSAADAERLPAPEALLTRIHGVQYTSNPRGTKPRSAAIGCSCADDNRQFRLRPTLR